MLYIVFRGYNKSEGFCEVAISSDRLQETYEDEFDPESGRPMEPADFIPPQYTARIEEVGRLEITGDIHLLGTHFSLSEI